MFIAKKTIKKIKIELPNIKNDDLDIDFINDNINDIYLIYNISSNYNIELFLKRFSNIQKLKFETYDNTKLHTFSIKENKNIIIEELELPNPKSPIYFSFSYLRSLSLDFSENYNPYKDFSLFNSNCTTNFRKFKYIYF